MAGDPPYRDGAQAAVAAFEQRRARVPSIEMAVRRTLPPRLREELAELEARLSAPLESMAAVTIAEEALAEYERTVNAALEIADNRRAFRHRTRWRRRITWTALVSCGLLAAGWVATTWRRYDIRERGCAIDCAMWGRCHPRWLDVIYNREGECIATSRNDCAAACRTRGMCEHAHESCGAATDDDCRQSERCRDLGECHVLRGADVHMFSGVKRMSGNWGVCAIQSDDDCTQSRACLDHGRCRMGEDACEAR